MMNSCKNPPYNLYALHGFLGLYTDWNPFPWINHPVVIGNEDFSLTEWAHSFNAAIDDERKSKNILLGYSMGGRLAMHAVLDNPTLWDAAIFISANPGLTTPEERAVRLEQDQKWADRFLNDAWDPLMQDWNAMPVFGKRNQIKARPEELYDRARLAKQLTKWSLGNQHSLTQQLISLKIPTLYIAGEEDSKFCKLLDPFKDHARVAIIPHAAHRVPWDQPDAFTNQVTNFIQELL